LLARPKQVVERAEGVFLCGASPGLHFGVLLNNPIVEVGVWIGCRLAKANTRLQHFRAELGVFEPAVGLVPHDHANPCNGRERIEFESL